MATFKINVNGSEVVLPPLTYGAVKANKEIIDRFETKDLGYDDRIAAAAAFLSLSAPGTDFDAAVPLDILNASRDVHAATFFSPEGFAPVQQVPNP